MPYHTDLVRGLSVWIYIQVADDNLCWAPYITDNLKIFKWFNLSLFYFFSGVFKKVAYK